MDKPKLCDNCGKQIGEDDVPYWVRLEIFASPDPPEIEIDDLTQDHTQEMLALIEKMEAIGPEECEAQVYEAFKFVICPRCRQYFHEHLKDRKFDLS